jgi:tetratricopeptide (TPR) repeat protein
MPRVRLLGLLLLLCAIAAPSASFAQDDRPQGGRRRADSYLFDAVAMIEEGRYEEAVGLLEIAVELDPAARRGWYLQALCWTEVGEPAKAHAALDRYEEYPLGDRERATATELRERIPGVPEELEEVEAGPETVVGPSPEATQPAPESEKYPRPRPEHALVVGGGIALGVGAGLWIHGAVVSQSRHQPTWESGQPFWYAGGALVLGGGIAVLAHIPFAVMHKNRGLSLDAASVSVSRERVVVGLNGRW